MSKRDEIYRQIITAENGYAYELRFREGSRSGEYLYVDPKIEKLTGIPLENFDQRRLVSCLEGVEIDDPGWKGSFDDYSRRFVENELQSYRVRLHFRRPDGQLRWISDVSVPVLDEAGRVIGSLGIMRDLSAAMMQQERFAADSESVDSLERLENLRILTGGVAHDFNNLLTAILNGISLASLSVPPEDELHETIEIVEQSAVRAAELTRQLLTFTGRHEVESEPVDLALLLEDMVPRLRALAPASTRLTTDWSRRVPAIRGASGEIRQMVLNLVRNAIEAVAVNSQGQITVEVLPTRIPYDVELGRVARDDTRIYAAVRVKDNGGGISDAARQHVFEPLFTTRPGARGLGLAAVAGVIRKHRGFLSLSTGDRGTSMTVGFPPADRKPESQ